MWFFDASALVKRYVRERESAAVRRALAKGGVAISRLSEVEVVSALARLAREGHIASKRETRAVTAFVQDLGAWHIVEISSEVTGWARTLRARYPLRSGDAIQLASALRLQQIVQEPLSGFVAFDTRLAAAAVNEGLPGWGRRRGRLEQRR